MSKKKGSRSDNEQMSNLTVRILAALAAVLMITMLGSQIYHYAYDKRKTTEANLVTINENISFKGVVVRDEKVLTYNGEGVLDYQYADGSKLSSGNVIAEVYPNEEAIEAKNKIENYKEEIENLKKAQNPGTTNYVQPEDLRGKVESGYKELIFNSVKENYSEMKKNKSELLMSMNLYDVVTKTENGFDGRIAALNKEIIDLMSQTAAPLEEIKAEKSGYFISYADGYENKLKLKDIDKLTEKDINDVIGGKVNKNANAIGKTFESYNSKIVGVVSKDKRITAGKWLDMKLGSSNNIYSVKVDSVRDCENDKNRAIVVLSCDSLDEALTGSRVHSVEIIFDEYKGIKVPRNAIRFKDGKKGVYVILGKDIQFKPISVIYEGDDYVLAENDPQKSSLLLYDQILLEVVSDDEISKSEESEKSGK